MISCNTNFVNEYTPFESILLVSLMVSAAVFCFICQLFRRISNAFVIGSCDFDANDGIEIDGSNPATSF